MNRVNINVGNVEGLPLSDAVKTGNLIFVSGMVGFGEDGQIVRGGIAAETHQTFRNIEQVLDRAGCTLQDIVKVSVILTDRADFEAFNDAYKKIFTANWPARISMVAGLTIDAKVEIDVIALAAGGKPL
jgi:2-iminobutanoate/2-iminopropanoate deaminase